MTSRRTISGMARNEAAKTSKTRNKLKKNTHKKGKPQKSKTSTSPSPSTTPESNSPAPSPPSNTTTNPTPDNIAIYPTLKNDCATLSTVTQRTKTPEIINTSEYYPQKLKRPSPKKKTILKHSYNLKDINERRKRKPIEPQKGEVTDHKDPQRIELSELSMTEIVRLMEDTEKLDDDDLMEILTCPSPVWWEDAPHDEYCEDPIEKELVKEAIEGISESPPPIEEDVQIRVQMLNKQKKNEKFIKKKNKLEHILGNLKNKFFCAVKEVSNEISKKNGVTHIINDEIINVNEIVRYDCKNEVPNKYEVSNKEIKQLDDEIIPVADDEVHHSSNNEIINVNTSACRLSESSEGDILSDISVNEDEMLKNLETIEIPIKQLTQEKKETEIDTVPKTLPLLLKFPYQANNVKENAKFFIESSKEKSSDDAISGDFDSISDANVRFLDDDDLEMLTFTENTNESIIDEAIDNFNVNSTKLESESSSPEKEITNSKIIKKSRKLSKKHTKYKDAKVVAYFKHNKLIKTITSAENKQKTYSGFISMPRSVANQRKLNHCVCGQISCVYCFSNRNLVGSIDSKVSGLRVYKRM